MKWGDNVIAFLHRNQFFNSFSHIKLISENETFLFLSENCWKQCKFLLQQKSVSAATFLKMDQSVLNIFPMINERMSMQQSRYQRTLCWYTGLIQWSQTQCCFFALFAYTPNVHDQKNIVRYAY